MQTRKFVIDPGSGYLTVYGDAVLYRQPNVAVVRRGRTTEVLAYGDEAMNLRALPDHSVLVRPVQGGIVKQPDVLGLVLRKLFDKFIPQNLFKAVEIYVPVPAGLSIVERENLEKAVASAGYRDVTLIESVLCFLPCFDGGDTMVAVFGAGVTDVGVVNADGIVTAATVDIGGDALDEKIKAAATISGRIAGGNVQISGSFTNEEAENLRKLLKTGVLPVELQVEEIQEVNASLGQDAIQSGIWALFVGFFSVFIFMMLYYRGGGLIADFALFLDVVFIFAILAKLGFTMTLTSLAGIILSIGMSVDANVIIFERMREEQRAGKSAIAGLKAGYDKALWALIDANVTTLIAALVLSVLGTGSIQGFAYTLAVGVVCSMFTAIFVTRLIFDFCYETLKIKRIQVMWGGKKYENN